MHLHLDSDRGEKKKRLVTAQRSCAGEKESKQGPGWDRRWIVPWHSWIMIYRGKRKKRERNKNNRRG